jgi:HEAT repeat protein
VRRVRLPSPRSSKRWGMSEFRLFAAAAAEALGKLGDPQAMPPLIKALHDWYAVRRSAAEALVRIGTPAVPALIQALIATVLFALCQRRRWAQSATPKPCPRS